MPGNLCRGFFKPIIHFIDGRNFLVFGRETRGLPETLLKANYERCVRIPMRADARSLNLSNSVAVLLYEALRQQGFPGLAGEGALTGRDEDGAWRDYV